MSLRPPLTPAHAIMLLNRRGYIIQIPATIYRIYYNNVHPVSILEIVAFPCRLVPPAVFVEGRTHNLYLFDSKRDASQMYN